jgi:hypothetical protein
MWKLVLLLAASSLLLCADSATIGWGKSFGATGATVSPTVQAVDASGNIYVAGSFVGVGITVTLATGITMTGISYEDLFVTKFTSSGAPVFAKVFGSASCTNSLGITTGYNARSLVLNPAGDSGIIVMALMTGCAGVTVTFGATPVALVGATDLVCTPSFQSVACIFSS